MIPSRARLQSYKDLPLGSTSPNSAALGIRPLTHSPLGVIQAVASSCCPPAQVSQQEARAAANGCSFEDTEGWTPLQVRETITWFCLARVPCTVRHRN